MKTSFAVYDTNDLTKFGGGVKRLGGGAFTISNLSTQIYHTFYMVRCLRNGGYIHIADDLANFKNLQAVFLTAQSEGKILSLFVCESFIDLLYLSRCVYHNPVPFLVLSEEILIHKYLLFEANGLSKQTPDT